MDASHTISKQLQGTLLPQQKEEKKTVRCYFDGVFLRKYWYGRLHGYLRAGRRKSKNNTLEIRLVVGWANFVDYNRHDRVIRVVQTILLHEYTFMDSVRSTSVEFHMLKNIDCRTTANSSRWFKLTVQSNVINYQTCHDFKPCKTIVFNRIRRLTIARADARRVSREVYFKMFENIFIRDDDDRVTKTIQI